MITRDSKIYLAGHKGMVGGAIYRRLAKEGFHNVVVKSKDELDLRIQSDVADFISDHKPELVILAAARVGGILANHEYPYDFLHDNLIIQDNIIHASHLNDVPKLIFLGSSCIYPKFAVQPMKESALLTGELETTNQWYAIAKISGVKLCEALRKQHSRDYYCLMPTNLYGPGDNFDLRTSHVLPAMIRKFHEAKENHHSSVILWGSGNPMREFLYVDDVADAVYFSMGRTMSENLYNVGAGRDITIRDLAELIRDITGHKGHIEWDATKPDGTPRKLMDVSRMENEGWRYSTGLRQGIEKTYEWFLLNRESMRT
ncbi:MAG: GDP-L-fucose synthase [Balneolaceae bacterium]|nr:MAG: GDP-L-fucose synthase [Balneolaceae bacterium]